MGDLVFSVDQGGALRANPVTATGAAPGVVDRLPLDQDGEIWATAEHPFYDAATGEYRPIGENSGYEASLATAIVYDLTVAHDHNFLAEGVLVHNKSGGYGGCTLESPEVCSGDAQVRRQPGEIWRITPAPRSEGGRGGQGGQGGQGATREQPVIVSFEVKGDVCSQFDFSYFLAEPGLVEQTSTRALCSYEASTVWSGDTGDSGLLSPEYDGDFILVRIAEAELEWLEVRADSH